MAFRFSECSTRAVGAFAEDYRVQAIPVVRLTWTMAQKLAGRRGQRCSLPALLNLALRRFLRNLRRYTDARFAAAQRS